METLTLCGVLNQKVSKNWNKRNKKIFTTANNKYKKLKIKHTGSRADRQMHSLLQETITFKPFVLHFSDV